MPTAPKCPSCNEPANARYKPFCSKRCADADLGRWFSGAYAIPGAPVAREPQSGDDEDQGR